MEKLIEFYQQHHGACTVAFGAAVHAAHTYLPKLWQAGENFVARAVAAYPVLTQAGGVKTIISNLWSGASSSALATGATAPAPTGAMGAGTAYLSPQKSGETKPSLESTINQN